MNRDWIQKIKNQFRKLGIFIRFVAVNFVNDDCTYRASALTFASLLAVVPLMSVGLAIFSSFPVFQELAQPLQDFIFQNFVPATGKAIQGHLQLFAAQVSKLSIWGVGFLFVTALLVMYTIESAMNKIWHVNSPRHGVTAFLLYWAILSLAPIFLGLSLAASSYLISVPIFRDNQAPSLLLNTTPYLLSLTGFTFLYLVVPNHPVKFLHGLIGGLFATVLFESAKLAFAYYLTQYDTYQLLYGAFATVPIFFVWVYWVWIITLLGAEICYALSVDHRRRAGEPIHGFIHALLWLRLLWIAQQHERDVELDELIKASTQPYEVDVDEMVDLLINRGLMHRTENGTYRLSLDMSKINLYQLSLKFPFRLPTAKELSPLPTEIVEHWKSVFCKNDQCLQESLDINVEQLFKSTDNSTILA